MEINQLNITILFGIITACKWLYEYQKKQKWEKNKYLIERLKDFNETPSTKQINKILNYNDGIPFILNGKEKLIDDNVVINSLITHDRKEKFTDLEYEIRNIFDEYFDNLSELIILSKCKLIDSKNIKLLLNYYIKILNGSSNYKSEKYINTLKSYLKFYDYDNLYNFIYN